MRVITIYPDDDGPVDVEHVEILAKVKDGLSIVEINELLRQCGRPAVAHEGYPDEGN